MPGTQFRYTGSVNAIGAAVGSLPLPGLALARADALPNGSLDNLAIGGAVGAAHDDAAGAARAAGAADDDAAAAVFSVSERQRSCPKNCLKLYEGSRNRSKTDSKPP